MTYSLYENPVNNIHKIRNKKNLPLKVLVLLFLNNANIGAMTKDKMGKNASRNMGKYCLVIEPLKGEKGLLLPNLSINLNSKKFSAIAAIITMI